MPFTMFDKTFDDVVSLIQNNYLFGEPDYQLEIICSDKTLIANYDIDTYEWTITEK